MTETTNLINKKVPYVEDVGIENAVNEIAKTLNSAKIQQQNTPSSTISSASSIGEYYTLSFSSGTNTYSANHTINHSLGSTPSGYALVDLTCNVVGDPETTVTLIRLSSNQNQIILRLNYFNSVGGPVSGTVKILLLR